MLVHACQEFLRDRKARGCADHSVDLTLRAERSLAIVDPLRYFGRLKSGKAIEALTEEASLHLGTMQTAMLVRLDVGRIETVRIQPKHDDIQFTELRE